MSIPRSKIDEIREASNITTILNEYGVELKPSGVRLTGLCPLHNERSPSFSVNPNTNTFKCFGCGEGGDVISLIQELETLSFIGAVEFLADKAGIVIDRTDEEDETYKQRQLIYRIIQDTADWYKSNFHGLKDDHAAKEELRRRNLLDVPQEKGSWLESNGIGYAPDGWDTLCTYLKRRGYSDDDIVATGLASKNADTGRVTDRYRGRLTWEIRDVKGRIVGFGARRLFESDNGPKYLNPPQTLLYDKSRILYGLDGARKAMSQKRELYLVEGYTDVMTLRAIGLDNVVAMSGTAFGEGHIALLRRVFDDITSAKGGVGKLIFVFDGDAAGQKAAKRVFEMANLPHDRSYGVALSEGDPDDIRQAKGDDYLRKALTNYIPFTEYALKAEMVNHDLTTPEGRLNYVERGLQITSNISSQSLRDEYKRKIAFYGGVPVESIGQQRNMNRPPVDDYYDENMPPPPEYQEQESPALKQQRIALALLFQYPAETVVVADNLGVTSEDFNHPYKDPYEDGSLVARYLLESGEPVVLAPHDISDENLGMELLHYPLALKATEGSLQDAIKNVLTGVRRFTVQRTNANINSQLAQLADGMDTEDADQIRAVEELLKARKEAAAKRRGGKMNKTDKSIGMPVPKQSEPDQSPWEEPTAPQSREMSPW